MTNNQLWIIVEKKLWYNDVDYGVWVVKAESAHQAKKNLIKRRERAGYLTPYDKLRAKPLSSLRDGMKIL